MKIPIWREIFPLIFELRSGFKDKRCFNWACVVIMAFCMGLGPSGSVTEIVRYFSLNPRTYTSLLGFFSSSAVYIEKLPVLLLQTLMAKVTTVKLGEYHLFAVDEIKYGKEGKRMPAVKLTYQSSDNNSKPSYIMGHSILCVALMAKGLLGQIAAMPILVRILGGIKRSPNDRRNLVNTTVEEIHRLLEKSGISKAIFVADAWYCIQTFIRPLMSGGTNIISRVKANAIAYNLPPIESKVRRGRKKKYGSKVRISSIFKNLNLFETAPSPLPGETCTIRYCSLLLTPRWLGIIVRYVFVIHPTRGKIALLSTDINLEILDIYVAYYERFKIELTFKNMVYVIGAFTYRFWSKIMKPIKRGSRDQYVHRASRKYKAAVFAKLRSYHVYMMCAAIACCLNQYLALYHPTRVWKSFNGWLRTINPNSTPSVEVTANALSETLEEFLTGKHVDRNLAKFISQKRKKTKTKMPFAASG